MLLINIHDVQSEGCEYMDFRDKVATFIDESNSHTCTWLILLTVMFKMTPVSAQREALQTPTVFSIKQVLDWGLMGTPPYQVNIQHLCEL